jgi:hypothetical protein
MNTNMTPEQMRDARHAILRKLEDKFAGVFRSTSLTLEECDSINALSNLCDELRQSEKHDAKMLSIYGMNPYPNLEADNEE